MKKALAITLGVVTSIGGFFDMGSIVLTGQTGARFGFSLVWVVALATITIVLYAEMAGRIATLSKRPVFDVVRERLGPGFGLANLGASFLINVITLVAEIAGVAIAFQLVTGVTYYLWVPLALILAFFVLWKVKFERMERAVGILGLTMLVFAVAMWRLHPDWSSVLHQTLLPSKPSSETLASYLYVGVALFGSAITPYELFFYSSGAVEEGWNKSDLLSNRISSYAGFIFGAVLSVTAIGVAALIFQPRHIGVHDLSTIALGPTFVLGKLGLAAFLIGLFMTTFGATLEVTLSNGYIVSQYFGWPWGKMLRPKQAARFNLVMIVSLLIGAFIVLTSLDPVAVTDIAMVFAAVGLPLTYFPILVVANDREYMGESGNGKVLNVVASVFLVVICIIALAAIPLMIWTKLGT